MVFIFLAWYFKLLKKTTQKKTTTRMNCVTPLNCGCRRLVLCTSLSVPPTTWLRVWAPVGLLLLLEPKPVEGKLVPPAPPEEGQPSSAQLSPAGPPLWGVFKGQLSCVEAEPGLLVGEPRPLLPHAGCCISVYLQPELSYLGSPTGLFLLMFTSLSRFSLLEYCKCFLFGWADATYRV